MVPGVMKMITGVVFLRSKLIKYKKKKSKIKKKKKKKLFSLEKKKIIFNLF
jgi:hypothetical protein